jgi:hypothetical protein
MRAPAPPAHDPSVRRLVLALAAALATGSVVLSAGPAAADASFAPGDSRTIRLQVPELWAAARQVDVTVGSVSQSENGCLDPERTAGDDCESDDGDLAGQLTGTVTLGLPDGAGCKPAQSAELDLSGTRTARLTAAVPGVRCLFVELTFRDDASNNRAQSDSLTFGLDLVARDFLARQHQDDVAAGTDGQRDRDAPLEPSDSDGIAPDGRDTAPDTSASDQAVDGPTTPSGEGSDEAADADSTAVATSPAGPVGTVVGRAPEGPVLDRLEAQVSVGDDGVVLQTQAADNSVQGQILTWGSLLLGAVTLGWSAFAMVLRRRRMRVAA